MAYMALISGVITPCAHIYVICVPSSETALDLNAGAWALLRF